MTCSAHEIGETFDNNFCHGVALYYPNPRMITVLDLEHPPNQEPSPDCNSSSSLSLPLPV